jgi:anti-sigma28 factor (negative regulator of flagellin synthesis)
MKVHDIKPVSALEMYAQSPRVGASRSEPSPLEDDQVQVSAAAQQLAAAGTQPGPSASDLKAISNDIARGTYHIDHGKIADGIIADSAMSGARRGN